MCVPRGVGRQKDDRNVAGFVAPPNQLGSLQTVNSRHVHIEQYDCCIVVEQIAKRIFAGARPD